MKLIFGKLMILNQNLMIFVKIIISKIKDFGPILRILLTFSSKSSGSIFEVIFNLGKIEVLNRISL